MMNAFRAGRFKGYTFNHFRKDLISGIIVGIIAIPLGMAFAIASGVKPEYGIYTTIIAGILVSILGGSRFQIGGPTGAFIPILLGIVIAYGYENLLIAGFMAGILLFFMGVFKLGSLIKYIPRPVTIGFTTGIAVIIFSGQIANFLGLTGVKSHARFIDNMREIAIHFNATSAYSVLTAALCLVIVVVFPKIFPRIPSTLIGLAGSALVAGLFYPDQVATIGSAFGEIQQALPAFQWPAITWEKIKLLILPALVIALLGGIESLLSAVVADGMTYGKHNSNRELIGQGIANIVTPLFGGIPATGAIARTATNIKSGAVSPVSGVIHGVVVLLILLLFAPLASEIPLASMAPILMIVAWNMSERKRFMHVLRMKSGESLVLVTTFLLTVFVDLTTGVISGILLGFILFIKKMSSMVVTTKVVPNLAIRKEKVETQMMSETSDYPQLSMYHVEGVLFFGSIQIFEESIMQTLRQDKPKIVLFRMGDVPFMDLTAVSYFSEVVHYIKRQGGIVFISEIRSQPREQMIKSGLYITIGEQRFFKHMEDALQSALKGDHNGLAITAI